VWGLILACQSVGLICGGLLLLRAKPQRLLLVATFGILLLAPPAALLGPPAPAAVVAVAAFGMGFGIEVFSVCWDTTMQQQIPGAMLSRVYAYDMLGSVALIPVGFGRRPDRRPDRHALDALRRRRARRPRHAARVCRAGRAGAQTTLSVFSSRDSR